MRKERHARKSAGGTRNELLIVRRMWIGSFASGIASIALTLLAIVLSIYVSAPKLHLSPSTSPKFEFLSINHSFFYFVVGVVFLGIVIVAIATFMRRQSRDVILLKQRLADVYSLAMRKSALNPLPKSANSND